MLILKFLRNLEHKEKHNLYNLPGVNISPKGFLRNPRYYNRYELDEEINPKFLRQVNTGFYYYRARYISRMQEDSFV